jgi:hypothetical protein
MSLTVLSAQFCAFKKGFKDKYGLPGVRVSMTTVHKNWDTVEYHEEPRNIKELLAYVSLIVDNWAYVDTAFCNQNDS